MDVCHHCDNRGCVRPDHLFVGTAQDNIRDMDRKGRRKPNPPLGERHPSHRFTWEQVCEIRAAYVPGYGNLVRLARIYKASPAAIRQIVKGRVRRAA